MELTPLLLALALFVVVLFLAWAGRALYLGRQQEQNLKRRAAQWTTPQSPATEPNALAALATEPANEGQKSSRSQGIYANTPLIYQRAGIYDVSGLRTHQTIRYLLVALPLAGLGLFLLLTGRPYQPQYLLVACILAIIGYLAPTYWLRLRTAARKKRLTRTFPDAIDLLMVCVQAGMGLDSAINRVAREIHVASPDLAQEFKILTLELKTGKARNDCLKNLALRTDISDIDNLVSLLIQADKYGTGISQALAVHAEDMRHKRMARLEEQAAKLPVKMLLPLIFFIFPAMFAVILGPAVIQIFHKIIEK